MTTAPRLDVDLGARSHPGKVRPNNEDHFLVCQFQRNMTALLTNLPEGTIPSRHEDTAYGLLVADGMGGRAAGEVASRTAISALVEHAIQTPDWIMSFDESRVGEVMERMKQRFEKLSAVLAERARSEPQLSGMGTTMTLALSLGLDAIVVHIGDSRGYLRRGKTLHRLTKDQTVAQSLVDSGAISQEEFRRHPLRHVLTGAISTKEKKSTIELHHVHLESGDDLLLCSDGLTDMVSDDAIAGILGREGTAEQISEGLIDAALEAGGKDNVTVVVARYRATA
ncbi:MAG TPA: protein phosphatase 2C domain-containing protein [Thermoanaerobaculia bacterium]|nr:protein phosphatase 2C domain-containing protein [Thermoanaerobaculia bacterium]